MEAKEGRLGRAASEAPTGSGKSAAAWRRGHVATRFGWGLDPTHQLSSQFLRYTVVSGGAYLVDITALFLLTSFAGAYYLVSAPIAFLLGLVTNYTFSTIWVFNRRRVANKSVEFGVFALIGVVGLGLNELFLWGFAGLLLLHYMQAKLISTGFVFLWNFVARKYILFR